MAVPAPVVRDGVPFLLRDDTGGGHLLLRHLVRQADRFGAGDAFRPVPYRLRVVRVYPEQVGDAADRAVNGLAVAVGGAEGLHQVGVDLLVPAAIDGDAFGGGAFYETGDARLKQCAPLGAVKVGEG